MGHLSLSAFEHPYNALGALHDNASSATGVSIVDQRPNLSGTGTASAGVPAQVDGQGVTINGIGEVTSLAGDTLTYNPRGYVLSVKHADGSTETYGYDGDMRRVSTIESNPANGANEYYVYTGNNIGAVSQPSSFVNTSAEQTTMGATRTYLYEGTDAPLRTTDATTGNVTYYEVDTTGNVRRLRASGGTDLGGYRYSAFGVAYPADSGTPAAQLDQPLRWKGRPFLNVAGGVYDMRARWWSPRLGAFVQADEFGLLNPRSTLWGWPGQNPYRWSDRTGRDGEEAAVPIIVWIGGTIDTGAILAGAAVAAPFVAIGAGGLAGKAAIDSYFAADVQAQQAAFAEIAASINDAQPTGTIQDALDDITDQIKGERGQTARPDGTDNPDKHLRWDAAKQEWYVKDNQTGKKKYKGKNYRPPPGSTGGVFVGKDDDCE